MCEEPLSFSSRLNNFNFNIMAPLFSSLKPPRPATVHPPVPKHSAMVWHLKSEKIGNEPGLQFVIVTFEGWADKGLTGPLYERDEPVNKHFLDTMKPMPYVLDIGTRDNPFTNAAGYPKKALAFRVTPGDEPHQFGNIRDPNGVAGMDEVEAWMSQKLIPHMMPIATWHRNAHPNMNNDDWYHTIRTADEILKGPMITKLITFSFIVEPYKWVDKLEEFYKMHHVCIYSFYEKGKLTKDFIKRYNLGIEHIDPEDYANHPTGSLANHPPSKSIFDVPKHKRTGVPEPEEDSKPPAVNKDDKVLPEEKKLPEGSTKPAAEIPKSPEEKEVPEEATKPPAHIPNSRVQEEAKAPTTDEATCAELLTQVLALAAQIPNLPNNQNAAEQLAAITAQIPKLHNNQKDIPIPAFEEQESESGLPKENFDTEETPVTEQKKSDTEETPVTEQKKSDTEETPVTEEKKSDTEETPVTEKEAMEVNSDKTVDSTPKHQGYPTTITPATAGLSIPSDPRMDAMVKRTLDLDDGEDDDIVNNKTKKPKRTHIPDDDDDADVDPLEVATQDIENILVDTDAEEEENDEELNFEDLSQHSSEELSQEQNPDNEDGNNDDMSNTAN